MDKILRWLSEHAIRAPEFRLDGQIVRFNWKGDNDGWLIGSEFVVTVGSWKSGDRLVYKIKTDEPEKIKKEIAKASRIAKKKKRKIKKKPHKIAWKIGVTRKNLESTPIWIKS